MRLRPAVIIGCCTLALFLLGIVQMGTVHAQTLDPFYAGSYNLVDLGSVPGVPARYGGLTLRADDPNILLIGGDANSASGALYAIGVVRDANHHIIGFAGNATRYADAAYNDGGVVYGPNNVLFLARWPNNEIGETKASSTVTDKIIALDAYGVAPSPGGLQFVPIGFAAAGHLEIVSWAGGEFYDSIVVPDALGTFNITGVTKLPDSLPGGPEGFIYVPSGSPLFPTPSILVSEYSAGNVSSYQVDNNGSPIIGTRKTFISGLTGAEGALTDPLTGDFLFSTFGGGERVIRVSGFAVPRHPTETHLSCDTPIIVGEPSTCTATVADISSIPTRPTGTVAFSNGGSSGNFSGPDCTLFPSGTAASCSVTYTPTAVGSGSQTISANYPGDSGHFGSTSSITLIIVKATPTIMTTISPSSSVLTTTVVTDQATITGGFPSTGVTGSVTYTYFTNGLCNGLGNSAGTFTVGASNTVPASNQETPSSPGSYSFTATYNGDSNNTMAGAPCELLTVGSLPVPSLTTVIKDASNNILSSVTVGATVHDNATLSGGYGTFTGTVLYSYFGNGRCSGPPAATETVIIQTGNVIPESSSRSISSAGSDSYQAFYGGDTYNGAATSLCEPLSVNKAAPSITSIVTPSSIVIGGFARDNATLAGGFHATGIVTYTAYNGPGCTVLLFTSTSQLGSPSAPLTPSSSGTYIWIATYNGDGNNTSVSTPCGSAGESLTVTRASPALSTRLASASISLSGSVSDTASLTNAFQPSGIVTYYLFTTSTGGATGSCTGTSNMISTVMVLSGAVPDSRAVTFNSTGTFGWNATYSGDNNNNPAESPCELLIVQNLPKPTLTTAIKDSSNAVTSSASVGTLVHDTAVISGGTGTITGIVTYSFFNSLDCTGTSTAAQPVSIQAGNTVPDSTPRVPAPAGAYSYNAAYGGDSNNAPVKGACEPLTIVKALPSVNTVIKDSANTATASVFVGSVVHDTATFTGGFQVGGIVTYTIFTNPTCTGSGTSSGQVTVTNGVVPDSSSVAASTVGSSSFNVTYSGDVNNRGTSTCERLTVTKASPLISTIIRTVAGAPATSVVVGNSVHDSAVISGGFQVGGTVVYTVFSNGACTGLGTTLTSPVSVTNGVVPDSGPNTPVPAGSYSFIAIYSGDARNNGATANCEPLMVTKASPNISTALSTSSVTVRNTVHDTATLTGGFQPSGSVTYEFFSGTTCTGPATVVGAPVAITNGAVPSSVDRNFTTSGSFSWVAVYSGDMNNASTTSGCEVLTVNPTIQHGKCGTDLDDCEVSSNSDLRDLDFEKDKIHFTAEGEPGTRGQVEVRIPKRDVPDADKIRVMVDHAQKSRSDIDIKSDDNDYHLSFSFDFHSPVDIEIDLNPATGATILGLDPLLFYGITGSVIALAVVGAVVGLARKRHSANR